MEQALGLITTCGSDGSRDLFPMSYRTWFLVGDTFKNDHFYSLLGFFKTKM